MLLCFLFSSSSVVQNPMLAYSLVNYIWGLLPRKCSLDPIYIYLELSLMNIAERTSCRIRLYNFACLRERRTTHILQWLIVCCCMLYWLLLNNLMRCSLVNYSWCCHLSFPLSLQLHRLSNCLGHDFITYFVIPEVKEKVNVSKKRIKNVATSIF